MVEKEKLGIRSNFNMWPTKKNWVYFVTRLYKIVFNVYKVNKNESSKCYERECDNSAESVIMKTFLKLRLISNYLKCVHVITLSDYLYR